MKLVWQVQIYHEALGKIMEPFFSIHELNCRVDWIMLLCLVSLGEGQTLIENHPNGHYLALDKP